MTRAVSREEWLAARKQLLVKEKQFTRQADELSRARRDLPWVRVEADYRFETEAGPCTLGELFQGSSQLVIYHLMFGPNAQVPCKSCSFWADGFNGITEHLKQRDVAFAAISRAPLAKLQAFAQRLGWSFRWVSSGESTFNFDYGVSFADDAIASGRAPYNYETMQSSRNDMPGISVFVRDARGAVFHSYSTFGRGIESMNPAYHYLDLVPKGRDEAGLASPMAWLSFRDEYAR